MQTITKPQLPSFEEFTENIPAPATYTLRVDVVNKDVSVKRIEINYNHKDEWSEVWPGPLEIADTLAAALWKFLHADKNSVGYTLTVKKINSDKPFPITYQPCITKPEFIVKKQLTV